jgi:serine protease inhibitor
MVYVDTGTRIAATEDAFGTDLYMLLSEGGRDTVFSPASVAAALQMALCGARGDTAAELATALHLTADAGAAPAEAAQALRHLSAIVNETAEAGTANFRVANTAWVQSGFPLRPAFVALLRDAAAATLADADFVSASEAARNEINRVIAEQTAGKITDLLAPGTVDHLTRLVLANAVYLKAPWAEQFPVAATRDAPFRTDGATSRNVPMMRGAANRPYRRADGYQAVLLPYQHSGLAMAIVLPDGPLSTLRPGLSARGLRGLLAGMSEHHVTLSLPRFRVEASFDLIPVLSALGVTTAFGGKADFSGITTADQLTISAVVHKAYIDVDEHGTEAAAATAVIMRALAARRPPPRAEMIVDRPFLFAIVHTATGTPLFLGQVTDPG